MTRFDAIYSLFSSGRVLKWDKIRESNNDQLTWFFFYGQNWTSARLSSEGLSQQDPNMAHFLLVLALLVIVAAPSAALVTHPLAGRSTTPTLRLRGGLGGVDSEVVAKFSSGLGVLSGAYLGLAADKACTAYGIKADGESDGLREYLLENMGWLLLAISLTGALTVTGLSLERAVGWALLPYSVATTQAILQRRAKKLCIDV